MATTQFQLSRQMTFAACEYCNTVTLVREQLEAKYQIGDWIGYCTLIRHKPGNTQPTLCEGNLQVISMTKSTLDQLMDMLESGRLKVEGNHIIDTLTGKELC